MHFWLWQFINAKWDTVEIKQHTNARAQNNIYSILCDVLFINIEKLKI